MELIITEKAIAGQRIANILAGQNVAQVREGNAPLFRFKKSGKEFMVIPLRGHIADVDFPKQFSYWLGTDLRELTNAPLLYVPTEFAIVNLLKQKAPEASSVIIATDADREGEAIGVEALDYIREKNPKIIFSRAYFSAITPKDIQSAFEKPGKVDFDFADSANCRREIDLIWGAVLTRYVSIASGKMGKEFLSVGRVQTPVLALIVDREKERLAFKQEKYWVLNAVFEKDKHPFLAEHKTGKFWEKEKAEAVLSKKVDKGQVTDVSQKQRVLEKPLPFNTTNFLRAATVLGLSAGEAMNIAESLYQMGFSSYPRTDNQAYPKNLDLNAILSELKQVPVFSPLVQKILSRGPLNPSAGKETKDHPPIHPVSAAPKEKLSQKQWAVYELICRRFFATLADEAITLNVHVEIDLNGEPFVALGQTIVKKGWKEYYPYSTLKEVVLPSLAKGDWVNLVDLKMEEKETQPPVRYSQSALIKLMDDLGLGTKSTRHEVINKLYSRRYIVGLKAIEPTQIAFGVIDVLEKYCKTVTEPDMTAQLEKEMDSIVAAKVSKKQVVDDSRKMLLGVLSVLLEKRFEVGSDLKKALRSDSVAGKCTRIGCDGNLLVRSGKTGKRFLGCSSYPACTQTYPLPQKGKLSLTRETCKLCNAPMIKLFVRRRPIDMCVNMNCSSKDEWKKKAADIAAKKEITRSDFPPKTAGSSEPKKRVSRTKKTGALPPRSL
ncbi:MAG: DNA topoisomerase I [Candidatus Diapherotrites archaeon]|uniref:DNA topoisomerase 1 n=1 Tax=Candidatus Iainarchaeum sp. TaxID=3101447 RepID=A0A8T4L1G4_9ARCH|nr:DNA topoisomerase I [Candidatus Diapherotrites archaeon]